MAWIRAAGSIDDSVPGVILRASGSSVLVGGADGDPSTAGAVSVVATAVSAGAATVLESGPVLVVEVTGGAPVGRPEVTGKTDVGQRSDGVWLIQLGKFVVEDLRDEFLEVSTVDRDRHYRTFQENIVGRI